MSSRSVPHSLLLVDDFGSFREFTRRNLGPLTYQVTEAVDGLDAVRKAETLLPDLILLDIGLPKLNGLEAARRIRKLCPETKIVFLSQESSSDIVTEALRLGAHGYVLKSRAATDMLRAIEAVLAGKRFVSAGLKVIDHTDSEAPGRHEIVFFSEENTLLQKVAQFVAAALNAGNPVLVVATETHWTGLVERLRTEGVDVDGAIQRGVLISQDATAVLSANSVNGVTDLSKFESLFNSLIESMAKAGETTHSRVAFFGECAGLSYAKGNIDAALGLERITNALIKTCGTVVLDVLCSYPLPDSPAEERALKSICAEHSAVPYR